VLSLESPIITSANTADNIRAKAQAACPEIFCELELE